MNDQFELPLFAYTSRLQNEFNSFIARHPEVWDLFESLTFVAIRKGHRHLSADMIMHRMRWEWAIETNEKPYRLNNNLTAYFARHFHNKHPKYEHR